VERIRLFVGQDAREACGLHVFLESLWKHTSLPVDLTVLTPKLGEQLNIQSDGTNAFSTLRFAIPHLMNYAGHAIFMDGADMMLRTDLAELWTSIELNTAVQVVKHDYQTKHPMKYLGTTLEAGNASYPRKNWSSVVIWNCGHGAHVRNREQLLHGDGRYLHRFSWLEDKEIGEIHKDWNHIPRELPANPNAKLVHFSLGLPGFEHYRHDEHSHEWQGHLKSAARGLQYFGR